MNKAVSTIVRLYSLLLFRFYGWVQMGILPEKMPSERELFSRAVWSLHLCLCINIFTIFAIVRLLTKGSFESIGLLYFFIILAIVAAYMVDRDSRIKIIRSVRREDKQSPEEERRKGKKVAIPYFVVTVFGFTITLFANVFLNKEQHNKQIQSTPEFQRLQEAGKEQQKWYEQRMQEQEEKMFQRRYPSGIDRMPSKDSLQR